MKNNLAGNMGQAPVAQSQALGKGNTVNTSGTELHHPGNKLGAVQQSQAKAPMTVVT
jgi:hypothetical protein